MILYNALPLILISSARKGVWWRLRLPMSNWAMTRENPLLCRQPQILNCMGFHRYKTSSSSWISSAHTQPFVSWFSYRPILILCELLLSYFLQRYPELGSCDAAIIWLPAFARNFTVESLFIRWYSDITFGFELPWCEDTDPSIWSYD